MEVKAVRGGRCQRRITATSLLTSGRQSGLQSRKHGAVGMPTVVARRKTLRQHFVNCRTVMQLSSTGKLYGVMRKRSGAANTETNAACCFLLGWPHAVLNTSFVAHHSKELFVVTDVAACCMRLLHVRAACFCSNNVVAAAAAA
eukprot:CAMPEP_0172942104 /NCGR_PEP_ID=MMETSP1075-20121228/224878_1 /TAXON_ID=2916 /ORGANISM="Ceratium fusus, Strain PA161109" /LENGTH=143 /DNA_ID=CAMNT_0013803525 /DNA_START=660 /DNA_END=1089 /DNA_ORIENTATION=+